MNRVPLAWASLVHDRRRALVTVGGTTLATLLMLAQLGFLDVAIRSAESVGRRLRCELVLVGPRFVHMGRPGWFPRERLFQAHVVEEVAETAPLYLNSLTWQSQGRGREQRVVTLGVDVRGASLLALPESQGRWGALERSDAVWVDRVGAPSLGAREEGSRHALRGSPVEVVGSYALGVGVLAAGSVVLSDQTLSKLLGGYPLRRVQLGLVRLQPGADVDESARRLREVLPKDVRVLTREELLREQRRFWVLNTSLGNVFVLGTFLGFAVGFAILYQSVATDVLKALPEYATLEAMGYSRRSIYGMVLRQSACVGVVAYGLGVVAAQAGFAWVREQTGLPLALGWERAVQVGCVSAVMAGVAGGLALGKLRGMDPAELL